MIDSPPRPIPLSSPAISEAEIRAVVDVLRSGQLAQGPAVAAFERAFAEYIGSAEAVATSSGTTALQLALLANGIGPGDEVITTPFSFIATANAIRLTGATPVFADIDADSLNLSPGAVEAKITSRTRAVLPVHLYGNPCDMQALTRIAHDHSLMLIEDACQAHGATFGSQKVGTFGTGCFSFYATKNMTCGEGGIITTSDPQVAARARLLRNHGMHRAYLHEELGFNFRMTDLHAAIGLAQLPRLNALNAQRSAHALAYDATLTDTAIRRPTIHPAAQSVWHQYTLLLPPGRRQIIAERLRRRGVSVGVYYPLPIHRQVAYRDLHARNDCPAADAAALSVLSIPVYPGLQDHEIAYIQGEVSRAVAE
jgi:perosamine synthetase